MGMPVFCQMNKKILPSFYIKTNQLTTITGVINGTRRKIQIQKSNIFHTFSRNNSVAQFIWNRRTCKFLAKYVKKWRWSLADETTHVCMFVSGERNFSWTLWHFGRTLSGVRRLFLDLYRCPWLIIPRYKFISRDVREYIWINCMR